MRERVQGLFGSWGLPGWLVPDYWFMLTLGIIVCCLWTLVLWRRLGRPAGTATDLLFYSIPSLFLGAKFFSWLQFGFPSSLADAWSRTGFALYGGLVGVLLACGIYYLVRPYSALDFLDALAPGLALGLFLGRIGCFMAGCDGGAPSTLPWAVRFPADTSSYRAQLSAGLIAPDAGLSLASHPTQLYESIFGLSAFVLLLMMFRRRVRPGEVFFSGMLWYGLFRLFSEPLRAVSGGWRPASWLSFAQLLSIILALGAGAGLACLSRPQKDSKESHS